MDTFSGVGRTAATLALLLIAACSSTDATGAQDNPDVAIVSVRLAPSTYRGEPGWADPRIVELVATILDRRGNLVGGKSVTWQLQQVDGNSEPASIAELTPTGSSTATVFARGKGAVGVVASVVIADGSSRSGTIYLSLDP